MRPETQFAEPTGETFACPSCRAAMARGMRFCRYCGFRLGEGVEEYAPTQRFDHAAARAYGAVAPSNFAAPAPTATGATAPFGKSCARRGGLPWVFWLVLSVVIFISVGGAIFRRMTGAGRGGAAVTAAASRSYVGVNDFDDFRSETLRGVLIDYVTPPGSPADRAGLLGGDVVTTFDGRRVEDASDLRRLLARTTPGKTVEVVFVRDGAEQRTTLTTTSERELERLQEEFAERQPGQGFFGINTDASNLETVDAPGLNVKGVRLDGLLKNRPAYLAGLRDGDIVFEFGGVPVRTGGELIARVKRAMPDSVVPVVLVRDGQRLELPFKVGVKD